MGGAYKKFKKAEKAKIKLKAEKDKKGAKLTKGTNVTKTDFKVRKIVIPEQLKERNLNEALSSKKYNIKECIFKLEHSSSSTRADGLRNLKDIITNYPEDVVNNNLRAVIQGISKLAFDLERDVRRDSFKILCLLFTATTIDTIQPFFDILTSYLKCAMTHIQQSIQEDSLLFLDALLVYVPSLVAINKDKILPHFLDMISKLRTELKPERTLTVHLGSKLTSIRWRCKVLEKLFGIFRAIINEKKKKVSAISKYSDIEGISHKYVSTKEQYFPIIRSNFNQSCPLPFLFNKPLGKTTANANLMGQTDEGIKLQVHAQMVMPLLFESWMEVRPQNSDVTMKDGGGNSNVEAFISQEAAFTLKLMVEIINQLWKLIQLWDAEVNNTDLSEWYRATYNTDFCENMIGNFPYVQGEARQSKGMKRAANSDVSKLADVSGGVKCYPQNLYICYLYCSLNKSILTDENTDYIKILNYLEKCIKVWKKLSVETTSIILKILKFILLDNNINNSINSVTKKLLNSLIISYLEDSINKDVKTKILVLLCDIVIDDNLWRNYGQEVFTMWLKMLPNLLCRERISYNILNAFSSLSRQNNSIFLSELEMKSNDIIENLSKIQITDHTNQSESKKLIINLLYWIKNEEVLLQIQTNLENEKYQSLDKSLKKYLHETIMLRMN